MIEGILGILGFVILLISGPAYLIYRRKKAVKLRLKGKRLYLGNTKNEIIFFFLLILFFFLVGYISFLYL